MQRKLITVLRWLVIAYITYITVLYLFQRNFLYYPVGTDGDIDEPAYQLPRGDITLRGWVINPGKQKAIIYFGGNAERVSRSIDVAKSVFEDFSVYLVNYRGYGNSEGEPTEADLYEDALAIYDDIRPAYESVAVIGRSLGTGVASYVASKREVNHTVLITPFDSIENIARERYVGVPVSLLLKDKYESWKRVKDITSSTLALIAENDRVVPRRFSENLLRYFDRGQLTTRVLSGTNHYNISHNPEYYPLIQRFLSTR